METNDTLKGYKLFGDFHTHTVYSCGFMGYKHGKGTILENVEEASKKGVKQIAISDHGPGHKFYGMKINRIPEMLEDIERAYNKYPDVKVFLSVEANIMNTESGLDVTAEEAKKFDFLIAGYHYGVPNGHTAKNYICSHVGLPSGSARKLKVDNTSMTVRALHENKIDILTHPGDKGPFDIRIICQACEETNTLLEISSRHSQLTVDEIKKAAMYDVKFVISSDAHKPSQVGLYEEGLKRAIEAGLDLGRIINLTTV